MAYYNNGRSRSVRVQTQGTARDLLEHARLSGTKNDAMKLADKTRVSATLSYLIKSGWVEIRLSLTDTGRQVLTEARAREAAQLAAQEVRDAGV